jgi:hypothetical protein
MIDHQNVMQDAVENPYKIEERFPDLNDDFLHDSLFPHCAELIKSQQVKFHQDVRQYHHDNKDSSDEPVTIDQCDEFDEYWQEYVDEAERLDGHTYWQRFDNAEQVFNDFRLYVKCSK